jgi:hypothetical protein
MPRTICGTWAGSRRGPVPPEGGPGDPANPISQSNLANSRTTFAIPE